MLVRTMLFLLSVAITIAVSACAPAPPMPPFSCFPGEILDTCPYCRLGVVGVRYCNAAGTDIDLRCDCTCVPMCEMRECGDNRCGFTCGYCRRGTICNPLGRCVPVMP